ncbi:MAG: hypothetical protein IKK33_15615 [Lachnospiraceae bacterium]|nr:hypothetical protein [Lachnospiraceae bacterium]
MKLKRKKGIIRLFALFMVMVLAFGGCEKKVESVESEGDDITEITQPPVTSEIPQMTEAPKVTEEPKVTEAPEVTETPQPDMYGEYDLDALFGPEQEDRSGGKGTTQYIGHNLIETEYAILDPADGVVLTQEDIELVDFVCKTMEEATGLSFLDAKYYKDIKVTFHIYDSVPAGSADNFGKAIDIDKSCLQGDGLLLMVHELVHILQFTSVYTGSFPFYAEGHADYWTFKIAEYILDNDIEGLVELVDVEREYSKWEDVYGNVDITRIYEKNIYEWMDQGCYFAFAESWPAYIYGRFFFIYLEDVYGDANAFLPIYARIPYAATRLDWDAGIAGRKYMDMEPLIKMMKVAYSEDVFDNFYPWMKEHEELFEPFQ